MSTTVNDAIVRKKYTATSTAPSSRNMSLPPLSLWYRHVHVHVRIRSSEQKDSGSSVKNSSIHTQNSHYFTEFWKINHNETEGSTYILLFVYYCKAANTEIEYIVHSSYLPLVIHCTYNHTNKHKFTAPQFKAPIHLLANMFQNRHYSTRFRRAFTFKNPLGATRKNKVGGGLV